MTLSVQGRKGRDLTRFVLSSRFGKAYFPTVRIADSPRPIPTATDPAMVSSLTKD